MSEQDFCCHRRKTADDKDIEQIKRTMLERVESIEPRIRDYAEEWHINIFRQKDLRWRYKKNSAVGAIVDFKNDTVVIASTDDWDYFPNDADEVENRKTFSFLRSFISFLASSFVI